jgi:hypothetical protein
LFPLYSETVHVLLDQQAYVPEESAMHGKLQNVEMHRLEEQANIRFCQHLAKLAMEMNDVTALCCVVFLLAVLLFWVVDS